MLDLTLGELKEYLRIDGSQDDFVLALLIDAAKEYMTDAGVVESDKARYKLAIMLYCTLYYENRDPSIKIDGFNASLESIIMQLKI